MTSPLPRIKLTPRLMTVASLVPSGRRAADIGTDHGYLPAYLASRDICPYIVAGDKHEKPLRKARELVRALQLEDKIEVRLGDGLDIIENEDKIRAVIIAGMGGKTIRGILESGFSRLQEVEVLILQPMVDIPLLRRWLNQKDFKIKEEKLAREGKLFYEIIVACWGKESSLDEVLLELGPRLIEEKKDPLLRPYLQKKWQKYTRIMENLKRSRQEIDPEKYNYLQRLISKIEEELKCI